MVVNKTDGELKYLIILQKQQINLSSDLKTKKVDSGMLKLIVISKCNNPEENKRYSSFLALNKT